jgi:phosphatidyl-myo-inositol dimannoside synthase
LRILLLTSEFAPVRGGIGTYAREIAIAASDLGADVILAAPDYGKDNAAEDRLLPFEIRRFAGGLHSKRDLPAKIRLARRLIGSGSHDVVHAADWPFFIPLALSRRLTTARTLMSVHGTEINETQTALKRLAIRCTGVFGPRSEVAANSHYTADLFRERFTIAAERIHAIPLGVSDFWFGERSDRAATRTAHAIAPDRIVIVTVARITRRKGHPAVLAALSMLPQALRERVTWLVIGPDGEADYVDEFKQLAAASGCDVRFLGQVPDEAIRDIYGAADLFCLTGMHDHSGRVEGFGLVYLEAGATGLPSVATAIGGVGDAVLHGSSGLLVPPAATDIADAIARLAERPELRSALAAGAIAHARALSWRRCAADTYGLSQSTAPAAVNMPNHIAAAIARHEDVPVFQMQPASPP